MTMNSNPRLTVGDTVAFNFNFKEYRGTYLGSAYCRGYRNFIIEVDGKPERIGSKSDAGRTVRKVAR